MSQVNALIITAFIFVTLSGCAATSVAQVDHTPAPSPEIPLSIEFCGSDINLDRTDMYERFDRELTSLVYGHGTTLLMLKRANKYFPVMAPILKANGIPEDFLYLACVESSLSHRAYSPAKAAGIWQFIPATATQYGLEVSDEVDERYNLEKATAAACRFFRNAYAKYGDWPTVMASFNGGMGRISTELEKQMQTSSFNLYLAEETSRYVFRIMALAEIFSDPAKYGFRITPQQFYQPVEYETVVVDTPIDDWAVWADGYGLTYAQLREENPWIRAKKLANKDRKSYTVRIPSKKTLSRTSAPVKIYNSAWISD